MENQARVQIVVLAVMVSASCLATFLPDAQGMPKETENLYVSSDVFGGPMVLEIIVRDDAISGADAAEPDVTFDGSSLRMTQGTDGHWYAYVADTSLARIIDDATKIAGTGMDFGVECDDPGFLDGSFGESAVVFTSGATCDSSTGPGFMQMIRAPKSPMSGATLGNNGLGDIQHWPFIQTFEMAAGDQMGIAYGAGAPDIVVTYNDPAGDSTFEFDRESYPRDSDVRMTIRDMQLNVDPTSEDLWTFDVDGSGEIYRRLFDGMGNLVKTDKEDIDPGQIYHYGAINGAKVYDMVLVSGPPGTDAIRTVDNSLQDSTQVPTIAGSLVTVRETAANSGIFENTDRLGAANLRTGSDDGILEFKAGYYDQGRYTGAFAGGMLGGDSLQRARISDPGLVDASGGKLGAISAGQQVLITSTISGYAGLDQTFTFLLKIQDKDGATVHLGWLAGRLAGAQEFEPALSWTPPAPGTYTATVFLWESIESPTALSSPKSIEITAT